MNKVALPVHYSTIELATHPDAEMPAGTVVSIGVRASCSARCDMRGATIAVMQNDAVIASRQLAVFSDGTNETEDIAISAPSTVGEHQLQVVLQRHEGTTCVHESAVLPVLVVTKPHETSMAVWDVPYPIVEASPLALKVGVACACHCCLSHAVVEIRDEDGVTRGTGRLSSSTWPNTTSLYWAEVEVTAPAEERRSLWSADFRPGTSGLPHASAQVSFGFQTSRPPDLSIRARLVEKGTGTPVPDAEVRVGRYEVFTDDCGEAVFHVPVGTYAVSARKDGFHLEPLSLVAAHDVTVQLEVAQVPTHARLVDMMKRFEGDYWRP